MSSPISSSKLNLNDSICVAGMVKETGEGTAKFLHSVVKGEIDAREGQSNQAQRAKDRVSEMAPEENCKDAAMDLVRPISH